MSIHEYYLVLKMEQTHNMANTIKLMDERMRNYEDYMNDEILLDLIKIGRKKWESEI